MSAKPRVVIVGSGLGGAFAAHGLAETHDVTVVELDAPVKEWQERVVDLGVPAQLDPHVGAGLGGTTALWHNGLIEIDEDVFAKKWPFPKAELAPYYAEAFEHLSGIPRAVAEKAAAVLRDEYARAGVHADRTPHMLCPIQRRNSWECLGLKGRVRLVRGEVVGFDAGGTRVHAAHVRTEAGTLRLDADLLIVAAGGLGTPPLLQALAQKVSFPGARHVGCFYEDHPMTFIGELTLRQPLYRFWNFAIRGAEANLRMPLVLDEDGLQISFQVRPAALYYRESRRERVHSVITQLRNQPHNPVNYIRLLRQWDDVLDVLSFRFGIRIPTKHYSLLMVAEQPALPDRTVWGERDPGSGKTMIHRGWMLSPEYLATMKRAAERFIAMQGELVASARFFPDWERTLASAAHHSGTARMSATAEHGVCDADARIHGLENVYVADGSLIPGSGIANTGLTIAALALRLAAHLRSR